MAFARLRVNAVNLAAVTQGETFPFATAGVGTKDPLSVRVHIRWVSVTPPLPPSLIPAK